MLRIRVGLNLACLNLPLKKAIPTAARLGADAVEIDARGEIRPREFGRTAERHLNKLLEDYSLRVCAVHFRTRRGYHVETDLQPRVEATKEAMSFARQIGCPIVVNYVGSIPASGEGSSWERLIDTLEDLGQHGQRIGATLAARTGPESGPTMHQLLQAMPPSSLAVAFDPAGLILHGHEVSEAASCLAPYIRHVYARDAVHDIGQGHAIETSLGEGAVDLTEVLSLLEAHDYRGVLAVDRGNTNATEIELQRAIRYLRRLDTL